MKRNNVVLRESSTGPRIPDNIHRISLYAHSAQMGTAKNHAKTNPDFTQIGNGKSTATCQSEFATLQGPVVWSTIRSLGIGSVLSTAFYGLCHNNLKGNMSPTKFLLPESEIPRAWLNIIPFLPSPPPPALHPGTKQPAGPADFAPLFPMDLILQEVSTDQYVEIPEEVLEVYRIWRPTPLIRAHRLEKALGTPAHLYYKYEGTSPAGSHKPNTAVPQAYYNKKAGVKKLTTETGAGQWGTALSFAGAQFGLDVEVWQVRASYDAKPYRRLMMETFGGIVHPSPSDLTASGRAFLAQDPNSPGSLGMAISEAVEVAATGGDEVRYALGSVLNHVLMHQTVIGLEALKQFEMAGEYPDVIFGCVGGGSNFGGLTFPFLHQNITAGKNTRIVAVEPDACPSMTKRLKRGLYHYPRMSTLLGVQLPPAPERIAEALARKTGSQIQTIGAKAANTLGLSTQVPARLIYLTDGTSRRVQIGNQTIELRHASPRRMAGAGHIEGTIIQALRHMGEGNITPEMIEHLKRNLGKKEKEALRREGFNAPTWLLPTIKQILCDAEEVSAA